MAVEEETTSEANKENNMSENYTLIRVKRKVTDDPEKALTVNSKKRKLEDIFEYAGSVALNNTDDSTIKEVLSRKRKNEVLTESDAANTGDGDKVARLSIFDIEHEEIQNKRAVDDIALNGAKLIREQLSISDQKTKLDEYVYDIYYAPRDVQLAAGEMIFEGHDNIDDQPRYDYNDRPDWQEDEDSNDEDNWRNEYPDEEDKSDESRDYDCIDDEERDNDYYDAYDAEGDEFDADYWNWTFHRKIM